MNYSINYESTTIIINYQSKDIILRKNLREAQIRQRKSV